MRTLTPIELTDTEQTLLARIDFEWGMHLDHARRLEIFEAAYDLTLSILERGGFPNVRWSYFTNPEYNIGSRRSRAGVFERNGTSGNDIFRHPHFMKYLRYLLNGPDLPQSSIDGFCRLVGDCEPYTSGDIEDFCNYAKAEKRRKKLDRKKAAAEFYKLALECDLDEDTARAIRDTVFRLRP